MNRFVVTALVASLLPTSLGMGDDLAPPIPVRAVAFSPGGQELAVGFGLRDARGGLVVWDVVAQQARLVEQTEKGVATLAYSPDGRLFAYTITGGRPQVVDRSTKKPFAELDAARRGPVVFSPDSKLLAMASDDKTLRLWDVSAGAEKLVLTGHKEQPLAAAFAPDGTRLVTTGRDGAIVWELASGKKVYELKHGEYVVSSAIFSPDGHWLFTGGYDGTTRIWNAQSGEHRAALRSGGDRLAYLAPASMLAAIHSGGRVVNLFHLPLSDPTPDDSARFADCLKRMEDNDYSVRETASAELVKIGFVAEPALRLAASDSPSAEVRIRARLARRAILWQPALILSEATAPVRAIASSPDGTLLAYGGEDGVVRLWDTARRSTLASFIPAEAK